MRRRRAGILAGAVLSLTLLSACTASPTNPTTTPLPTRPTTAPTPPSSTSPATIDPDAVLAVRSAEGGLCPTGLCSSAFTVRADGSWEARSGADVTGSGTLSAPTLRDLVDATSTTAILAAPAFTGTCPIAYDGQELTYTWTSPDGTAHHVSACDRAVPDDDPLVVAIGAAEREATSQQ